MIVFYYIMFSRINLYYFTWTGINEYNNIKYIELPIKRDIEVNNGIIYCKLIGLC